MGPLDELEMLSGSAYKDYRFEATPVPWVATVPGEKTFLGLGGSREDAAKNLRSKLLEEEE